MKSILYLSIFILLTSCVNVYFTDLQPKGGQELDKVPTELHGMWTRGLDTTWINADGMTEHLFNSDSLDSPRIKSINYLLSDTLRIVKSKDLYVAHLNFIENPWMIFVIQKDKKGNITFYTPMKEPYFKETKEFHISKIERKPKFEYKYNEETFEYEEDTIHVSNQDSLEIESIYYSGQMSHKELKTIIRKENFIYIYDANGTFEERSLNY